MAYDFSRLSVLVIEDNLWMRRLLHDVLDGFDIKNVRTASDGHQALEMLRDQEPDVVIADWRMEPTDGLEFTRAVRRGEGGISPFTPIIMLTGHTERERVAQARDGGVTEFLAKPVTAKALYSRLASIVERPRPFVRGPDFVGPDRRRRQDPAFSGRDRRGDVDTIEL